MSNGLQLHAVCSSSYIAIARDRARRISSLAMGQTMSVLYTGADIDHDAWLNIAIAACIYACACILRGLEELDRGSAADPACTHKFHATLHATMMHQKMLVHA